mmetsp:Transcript_1433/g.2983  ORF Transcript_1433/g.2983 Transcript_1433/m.2983 type:complete len:100 (-) Transcript_1433:501-800(-)
MRFMHYFEENNSQMSSSLSIGRSSSIMYAGNPKKRFPLSPTFITCASLQSLSVLYSKTEVTSLKTRHSQTLRNPSFSSNSAKLAVLLFPIRTTNVSIDK